MLNDIFTFKVSFEKNIYRTIEIKGSSSLYKFSELIIDSFDFDMDHAFGFFDNIKNVFRSHEKYELFSDMSDFSDSDSKSVKKTKVGTVFTLKKKMAFLFDYGDEWIFLVECINISDPNPNIKYPRLVQKVGESPQQYPDYDEEDEEEF